MSILDCVNNYLQMRDNNQLSMKRANLLKLMTLLQFISTIKKVHQRSYIWWGATLFLELRIQPVQTMKLNKNIKKQQVNNSDHRVVLMLFSLKLITQQSIQNGFQQIKNTYIRRSTVRRQHPTDLVTFATSNGNSISQIVGYEINHESILPIVLVLNKSLLRQIRFTFYRLNQDYSQREYASMQSDRSSKEKIAIKFAATNLIVSKLQLKVMNLYGQLMVTLHLIKQSRYFFEKQDQLLNDNALSQKIQTKLQCMNQICFVLENFIRNQFYHLGEMTGYLQQLPDVPQHHQHAIGLIHGVYFHRLNDYFNVLKETEMSVSVYEPSRKDLGFGSPQLEPRASRPRLWLDLDSGPKRDSAPFTPFMHPTFTVHSSSPSQRSSSIHFHSNDRKHGALVNSVNSYLQQNQRKISIKVRNIGAQVNLLKPENTIPKVDTIPSENSEEEIQEEDQKAQKVKQQLVDILWVHIYLIFGLLCGAVFLFVAF